MNGIKKKLFKRHDLLYPIIALSIVGVVAALAITVALCIGGTGNGGPESAYSTVQILEKKTDNAESSYAVGTYLNGTDFSAIGQVLSDKIEQEWKTFSSMTEEKRLLSSKLWGHVSIQADTWNECEEIIGLTVDNPLESMDWLSTTGYIGMESATPGITVKHIMVSADSTLSADRKVNNINITAGYSMDELRITLNATACAESGIHQTASVCNGYAAFEEESAATGSGIPVLIVITDEANNNGYYNGDYYDPIAYWVKDNVFYTLRVLGDETNKEKIMATLYRILEEM